MFSVLALFNDSILHRIAFVNFLLFSLQWRFYAFSQSTVFHLRLLYLKWVISDDHLVTIKKNRAVCGKRASTFPHVSCKKFF